MPSDLQVLSELHVLSKNQVPSEVQVLSDLEFVQVSSAIIFNSANLLHYLKIHRFAKSKLTWLLH